MSVDDTKLNYLSTWDIDQLIASGTTSVSSGITAVYTIPSSSVSLPVYEIQFQNSGKWYQTGAYSTNGTLAGLKSFYTYINAGVIYISTTVAGNIRYFVWTDKVDY
jgi:hypothetical protein